MHNLKTVVGFEFKKTVNKKAFWISVLTVPMIFVIIFGFSYLSGKSASEIEQQAKTGQFSLAVLDESGLVRQSALDSIGAKTASSREAGVQKVKEGSVDSFIYYPADPSSQTIEVFGQDVGLTKNSKYSYVAVQLLKSSAISKLSSPKEAAILQKDPATKLIAYNNGAVAPGIEQIFLPSIFLVLFYLVIILLGNHMLTSTTEEKENRVIEIILTTIDAGTLIIGKILAMVLVGILQIVLLSLPVIIGLLFFPDKINIPQLNFAELIIDPARLLLGAALFVFSFLLFTGLLVTIGAVVPTAKEAGNFFGIAVFFMFVPLYAVMAIIADPSQTIVKVFSFFPLTAPMTLMLRNAVGNLAPLEAAVGVAVIAVTAIASLFIAIRAFRYGTVEYERKLTIAQIFKG